ncbi:hypothetical protein SAMN05444158_3115 [Bradyrhizobium canariense]|uniref:Uncharacterized protein n=1 Tax=Bradyrhizobium canariense TaxID=255045 RepID=A0A1H1UUW9_9BRAD|nr:hypothetical protein SAMN05444158_3115 [Bradyrhizobium canariense]
MGDALEADHERKAVTFSPSWRGLTMTGRTDGEPGSW